jgi:hypothetical protein
MDSACKTHGGHEKDIKISVRKPKGKHNSEDLRIDKRL